VLNIKPAISVWPKDEGKVKVLTKKIGAKNAMKYVANSLIEFECDENYPIVPSYTYNEKNLDQLIAMTDEKFKKQMTEYDNLDPAIACHWGPNAYGYIFVSKK
jgi:fatty acid-binding protein DegV